MTSEERKANLDFMGKLPATLMRDIFAHLYRDAKTEYGGKQEAQNLIERVKTFLGYEQV